MTEKLISLAKKGDELALAQLLQENYQFVYKYLLKITWNEQMALDITQETMMKAIQKLHLYKGESKFSSWLITIATNLFIDIKRKEKQNKKYVEDTAALRKLKWSVEQDTEWLEVNELLIKLEADYRIPVLLKHYYGYQYDEIAKMLGIKEGTVKSRVHYGISFIRKELNNE